MIFTFCNRKRVPIWWHFDVTTYQYGDHRPKNKSRGSVWIETTLVRDSNSSTNLHWKLQKVQTKGPWTPSVPWDLACARNSVLTVHFLPNSSLSYNTPISLCWLRTIAMLWQLWSTSHSHLNYIHPERCSHQAPTNPMLLFKKRPAAVVNSIEPAAEIHFEVYKKVCCHLCQSCSGSSFIQCGIVMGDEWLSLLLPHCLAVWRQYGHRAAESARLRETQVL